MKRASAMRGFTYLEVVISCAIILTTFGFLGSLVGDTQNLTRDTRNQTRAVSEHRRNLKSLANLLRSADLASLQGFESGDEAAIENFTFERVMDVGIDSRSTGGVERLAWRPSPTTVEGVDRPGSIYLVNASGEVLVADRVPADGFQVRQQGQMLAVRLTTYYRGVDTNRTSEVTSETAITLRN